MRETTIECPECGAGVRLSFVDGAIVTGKADIEVTGLHYRPLHKRHSKDVGEPMAVQRKPRHKWAQGRSND